MRHFQREGVQPESALVALRESYTNPDLTQFVRSFIGPYPPTRKEDMLAVLVPLVEGEGLVRTWEKLTPVEQAKVAQTAWSEKGVFDRDRFAAVRAKPVVPGSAQGAQSEDDEDAEKEEIVIGFGSGRSDKRKLSLLELIMPHGVMPRDVQQALRKFVPKPKRSEVSITQVLPESVGIPTYTYNPATGQYDRETRATPVVIREMERTAIHDLMAVLRLIDSGKVGITDKNRWPTPAAIRQIAQVLNGGDYYPDDKPAEKSNDDLEDGPGPIRAFAWPLIMRAGKLAQVRGARLELTRAGRAALVAPPHETLRGLWQRWEESNILDELRRINVIRGQTGKGHRYLTDPLDRRAAIESALREAPVGQWVMINELSHHMRAAGHEFEVTSEPWTLYISDQQYGSLGDSREWSILQFRYMLALLMEYAATLGIIDIAFIPPNLARTDFADLWGADDLEFLSRYDGLMFLRLTALGAYILGVNDSYSPPPAESRDVIRIDPSLEIIATGALSSADMLLLDTFAEKAGDKRWRLTPPPILDAEASGRSMREFIAFLESASGGAEFPDAVDRFFAEISARANALQDLGPARLIGCADQSLATFIANHPTTAKLCSLAGPDRLVVAAKDETPFLRALRKLGFVPRRTASGE